ncbi:hypothetical protein Avbf_01398 [Armadillidium vulgare]|nr:hypothetical protein Avbf_01398 [Armadillidium vulgare]
MNPVQIFSSVSKDNGAVEDMDTSLTEPIVQLEIENPDINATTSIEPLSASRDRIEENVFMIPPLLRVRRFAIQDRIPISIDEIKRRISPPESLSQALILSLLRLNKERAKHLRKALSQFGITELPSRSTVISSFSRLSEAESRGLAEDYYYLASRYMRVRDIHYSIIPLNGGERAFTPKAKGVKLVLEQILTEIEKQEQDLELLTHGFSPLILRGVFNILMEILAFKEKEKEFIFDLPQKDL